MSDLPVGWEWATLGDIGEIQGGIQKQSKRRPNENPYPFLRVANVPRGSLDLEDVHQIELFEGEIDRYRLQFGDLLIVEGNGSLDQLGRAAMWRDQISNCVHQNHLIRVRPRSGVEPSYLAHAWNAPVVTDQLRTVGGSTSGLHTLSIAKIRPIRIPLPPTREQQRIVATLEEHLSRVDAGRSTAVAAERRIKQAKDASLARIVDSVPVTAWSPMSSHVVESRYGTSVKCSYDATGLPVLRIPNIANGRIDMTDLKYASNHAVGVERLRVHEGDLLIVRTNGAKNLIGRSAVANRDLDCAFASYLIRFRFASSRLLPEWARLCMESPLLRRVIEDLAASSAGQYNLSIAKLASLQIPVPTIEDQLRLIGQAQEFRDQLDRVERTTLAVSLRSKKLIRSLLADAFAGRLVMQDPNDEPASVLLDRIRAERAVPMPARRRPQDPNPNQETLT